MGLFAKIARVLGSSPAEETPLQKDLDTLNKDGRLHARYVVHGDGVAILKLDNGMTGMVKDISYGGMAVRFGVEGNESSHATLPASLKGTFTLLDRQMTCRLSPVRTVSHHDKMLLMGFSLHHEGPETLIFLRDFIEPLRCGRSMVELPADMRSDRYKDNTWSCFRGDGPTDLLLKMKADGSALEEALLTFRINETYCDMSLKAGTVRTARMADKDNGSINGSVARMAMTTEVDKQVLRSALCILMSLPAAPRKATLPMLSEGLKLLNLAYQEGAA